MHLMGVIMFKDKDFINRRQKLLGVESEEINRRIHHDLIRKVLQYRKSRKRLPEEFFKLIGTMIKPDATWIVRSQCGSWIVVYNPLFSNEYKTIFLHVKNRGKHLSWHLSVNMESEYINETC